MDDFYSDKQSSSSSYADTYNQHEPIDIVSVANKLTERELLEGSAVAVI